VRNCSADKRRKSLQNLAVLALLLLIAASGPAWAKSPRLSKMSTTVADGLGNLSGVAVDSKGNIYVTDNLKNEHTVKQIPASCAGSANCIKTLGGGFGMLGGVAVDSEGNVYVADRGNKAVKQIPASCISGANNASCIKTLGGGFMGRSDLVGVRANLRPFLMIEFEGISDVAVDARGNVYVADNYRDKHSVKMVPSSCINGANDASCVKTLGGGFTLPVGVAVDGSGNVYVIDVNFAEAADIAKKYGNGSDKWTGAVKEIPASCINGANNEGCVKALGGGFGCPHSIAVDSSGNVYIIDINSDFNDTGMGFASWMGTMKEIPSACINGANNESCVNKLGSSLDIGFLALDGGGSIYFTNVRKVKKMSIAAVTGQLPE